MEGPVVALVGVALSSAYVMQSWESGREWVLREVEWVGEVTSRKLKEMRGGEGSSSASNVGETTEEKEE